MNILSQIVQSKKLEIKTFYQQYDLQKLRNEVNTLHPNPASPPLFYQRLAEARSTRQAFFITEFKRKSPSEGWINANADLSTQIHSYIQAGASAISVLTDEPFFGGNYADLKQVRSILDHLSTNKEAPLLLQKEFILDPIQLYLAKLHGADFILLIAAILEPEHLDFLKHTAESIGLGVLVEVHEEEELKKIQHLDFQVLGINNRDLKTFRTALNRFNVLKKQAAKRYLIAESGILNSSHFQMVHSADGFLIGTGLMRHSTAFKLQTLQDHFQCHGRLLFKACGIRTAEILASFTDENTHGIEGPDFIGINFSPISNRRADTATLEGLSTAQFSNAVAVFYKNTEAEIREILAKYPFKIAQFYAQDVSPEFVRSLKVRVMLAVKVGAGVGAIDSLTWSKTINSSNAYAADIDCFILDGAVPGSGTRIQAEIPTDFPYPFLLAGGLNAGNLEAVLTCKNCIGVDIASGIETDNQVDLDKVRHIAQRLSALSLPHDLPNCI